MKIRTGYKLNTFTYKMYAHNIILLYYFSMFVASTTYIMLSGIINIFIFFFKFLKLYKQLICA